MPRFLNTYWVEFFTLRMKALLAACKPLILLDFHRFLNATWTNRSILWGTPIFYCQFVNFLMLLHRNVQLFLFGNLYAEGLVPYYIQEVPYDRRKLQLPNESDAASQPVSRKRKVKNPHHS